MSWQLAFSPLVPLAALGALAALSLLLLALAAARRQPALIWRALALAFLLAALADPALVTEERRPLPAVVAIVADRSPSQGLGRRTADTDAAVAILQERLARLPGLSVRTLEAGIEGDGTRLFGALSRSLSDVPPDRVAGVVIVTDGEVHDAPRSAAELGLPAPVHALVTGEPDEADRRIVLLSAPKFGLVGKDQPLSLRVEDLGAAPPGAAAEVVIRRDGEEIARRTVPVGEAAIFEVGVTHAGANIIEAETAALPGEVSDTNNRTVALIEGIRENLRVLLVSGEPHAGERTWRNLLKSDASVDLVHFTILRPPEKQDGTPINELSLIAFPTRELFDTKISEFDLIIFDRYQRRGVLPLLYFDNIARFVEEGGAFLMAAGPDPGVDSVYDTPLVPLLPARPTGVELEEPFRPAISEAGRRHPVTRDLPGGGATPPGWSRWFRLIDAEPDRGEVVMDGPGGRPLLVLSREGEGRVAMLLSDHVWLWARGFEGGGPHVDLLRRLAHWLMREPDLEEEALRLSADGDGLVIERQTLGDRAGPVDLSLPDGSRRQVALSETAPGLFRARVAPAPQGLARASDGELTALAHLGPVDPREYRALLSTTEILAPLAQATGGAVVRLRGNGVDSLDVPRLVPVGGSGRAAGDGWIGLRSDSAYEVTGLSRVGLFSGFAGLALLAGAIGLLWWREGR